MFLLTYLLTYGQLDGLIVSSQSVGVVQGQK